jgi:hypothetical protein
VIVHGGDDNDDNNNNRIERAYSLEYINIPDIFKGFRHATWHRALLHEHAPMLLCLRSFLHVRDPRSLLDNRMSQQRPLPVAVKHCFPAVRSSLTVACRTPKKVDVG